MDEGMKEDEDTLVLFGCRRFFERRSVVAGYLDREMHESESQIKSQPQRTTRLSSGRHAKRWKGERESKKK